MQNCVAATKDAAGVASAVETWAGNHAENRKLDLAAVCVSCQCQIGVNSFTTPSAPPASFEATSDQFAGARVKLTAEERKAKRDAAPRMLHFPARQLNHEICATLRRGKGRCRPVEGFVLKLWNESRTKRARIADSAFV